MEVKRILLITTVGGFISQFEQNDVRLLKEMGYEVYYAANFSFPMYEGGEEALEQLGVIKIPMDIQKSPMKIASHRKVIKELIRIVEEKQISVIHCHTPVGGFIGRIIGRHFKGKVKVIYTAHGFHFSKKGKLSGWIFYPVERFLARYTDALVTINHEDERRAKGFPLRRAGGVYRIPGVGIRSERLLISISREEARTKWNVPRDAFHLVTVGELNTNKNQQVIIEAIAKLNDPKLVYTIAGQGPGEDALRTLIKEKHLEEQVRIVGYQSQIAELLKSADVFCFPSRREGLGMAALEAMAAGKCVIASDNRGTREYMKDHENGLVYEWDDVNGFARGISLLKRKPQLRRQMEERAKKTAERFSVQATEAVMKKVYAETLR